MLSINKLLSTVVFCLVGCTTVGFLLGNAPVESKRVADFVEILKSVANESAKPGSCFSKHLNMSTLETFVAVGVIFGGSKEGIIDVIIDKGVIIGGNFEVLEAAIVDVFNSPSGLKENAIGFLSASSLISLVEFCMAILENSVPRKFSSSC